MPNAMCRPALGRPTNLPGFLAGGFSSSSLELSLLLVDGFLFAWAPFGTSFLFLAAGDLRAQGLSEALRGAGRAEGHRVPRALTAASRRRCPGGRPRWGPAPSKAREAALASVHQSVGRSVSQSANPRPAPPRPGPPLPAHRRRLLGEGARCALAAALAQEREHEGEQVAGHGPPLRHDAHADTCRARTRQRLRAYVSTYVRTCMRAHRRGPAPTALEAPVPRRFVV